MDAAKLEERALPIPEGINAPEDQVLELIRVWWNGNAPLMNIRPALQEPANVGVVLAELAWHFSHAYAQHHGMDQAKAFEEINESWTRAHAQALVNAAANSAEGQ